MQLKNRVRKWKNLGNNVLKSGGIRVEVTTNMIKNLLFMGYASDYIPGNGTFSFEAFFGFLMGFVLVGDVNIFYGTIRSRWAV